MRVLSTPNYAYKCYQQKYIRQPNYVCDGAIWYAKTDMEEITMNQNALSSKPIEWSYMNIRKKEISQRLSRECLKI